MKRIAIIAVAVAGALTVPATAQAAPILECGQNTTGHWSYGKPTGAGVWNLTTRNVRCGYARGFVYRAHRGWRSGGRPWYVHYGHWRNPAFTCRELHGGWEFSDIRCTARRGRLVIHWQTGS
jgi:hypothetical protein